MDDAATQRHADDGRAIFHLQLRQDVFHVHLRGLFADAERSRDFGRSPGGRELAEFRKRYPDCALPEDLRQ